MAASANALWKRTRRKETPEIVGKVFEDLARQLWKAAEPTDTSDLIIPENRGLEVKAAGSRPCRVDADQLQRYENIAGGFPLDGLYYAIFFYNNGRRNGSGRAKRGTKLNVCKTKTEVQQFVIRNCTALFVVDYRILVEVSKTAGTHVPAFPGDRDRPAVIVHQSLLSRLAIGDTQAFKQLGLSARQWKARQLTVRLPGSSIGRLTPVEFPLYTLGAAAELSAMCSGFNSELVCA